VSGQRLQLMYIDVDEVVLFQRSLSSKSRSTVTTGIPDDLGTRFARSDQERLREARRRRLLHESRP
jgi:hypothetical protein